MLFKFHRCNAAIQIWVQSYELFIFADARRENVCSQLVPDYLPKVSRNHNTLFVRLDRSNLAIVGVNLMRFAFVH